METSFLFASRYNWLVAVAVIAAIWIAVKNIQHMAQQKEQSDKTSLGLDSLLLTSGAAILLGCLGYFMEMKNSTCLDNVIPGSSFVTIITTVVESGTHIQSITNCYIQGTSAMLAGLFASLSIALLWFVLRHHMVKS